MSWQQLGGVLIKEIVRGFFGLLAGKANDEPEVKATPVDIAIATKSAVSADREGKIASEMARKKREEDTNR